MASTIFSDAWFRVCELRVALLPSVEISAQVYRGREWHVLQDTFTQRYFRVSKQACDFIRKLSVNETVESVWENFVDQHPGDAPSQEEVIQILSQLHMSNLLYTLEQSDSAAIVERYKKQKNKELLGKFASFLYIRVPLWNPNAMLDTAGPFIRAMTGPVAGLIWLLTVIWGATAAFENSTALVDQTQGILSVANLPWLYLCLTLLKLFHEAGHAFVCKRFGGEVRMVGVMFLLMTPLPYVDASSSWGFSNKWHRVYVSFAGMAVEFFFAAVGAIVWTHTGPGLMNSLAFNVMLIGSVSSILFNGNPLLRFDAYYMLSDTIEIPNLYQRAQQQWKYFGDRYILGTATAQSKATDRQEWYWLTAYGFLSFAYLLFVTFGISLFLMDQWLPLGLTVLIMTLYGKFGLPAYQFVKHLNSQTIQANRQRALVTVASITVVLVVLIGLLPIRSSIMAKGVLRARDSNYLYAQAPGRLDQVWVHHGDAVRAGQRIASLKNPDLIQELIMIERAAQEVSLQYRLALHRSHNELSAIQQQIQTLTDRIAEVKDQISKLELVAQQDGEWVAPDLHELQGTWLQKGHTLGEIVDRRNFSFLAAIPQESADYLFKKPIEVCELRLTGQADVTVQLHHPVIVPIQSNRLPSVALGWMGGGDLAVSTNDPVGDKTRESFYMLRVDLPHAAFPEITTLHGLTGTVRIRLDSQPLATQAYRGLKQLIQKRYAI